MSTKSKRPALGKGLSALLESSATDITSKELGDASVLGSVALLPVSSITANPFNPRTHFEEEALQELSKSIAEHGIIQPLTVRKMGRNKYQLISGERRFRAAQMAKLEEVPAYIRVANDQTMLEMALVENIQREDLNAIEVALSYQRLIDECHLTQEELAQKVAKSRTSVTNHLRLLKLPVAIQLAVRENEISMGHARALVSVGSEEKQMNLCQKVIAEELSVRNLEKLIKEGATQASKPSKKVKADLAPHLKHFTTSFGEKLATKVQINQNPQGDGKLIINFNSEVDLNRIIAFLND